MQWDRARQVSAEVKDKFQAPEPETQRWLDPLCFS